MSSTHPGSRCAACWWENKLFLLAISVLLLTGCVEADPMTGSLQSGFGVDQLPLSGHAHKHDNMESSRQSLVSRPASQHSLVTGPLLNVIVEQYSLVELDLETDLRVTNPYDPDEIDLIVSFSAPSGKVVEVGAFWYQAYNLDSRQADGTPGWKVRFTPDETGSWKAIARVPALELQSTPIEFRVIPSDKPGFVRVNPNNPHYLAFDNGDFFFPIGLNMAWWRDCCDPVRQYHQWLDQFSANGGNTIRVWMAAWSFGIEWKDTGLGDYGQRQYEAWLLDQLFLLTEEHDIKVILVLVNHGSFSLDANTEWEDNPYNIAVGGPLSDPGQFVTDPVAKSYFQRRLHYIINRWSYSPDLLAWEWFNEVDLTPISDEALKPWLQEMTAYLHQWDVNHHLTTNSFSVRSWSSVWQLPELDIVQRHDYATQVPEGERDLASRAVQDFQALAQNVPEKPILLSEFGFTAVDYGDDIEKSGIHLHNGLWATTFSGYAGSGMYWWWDNYIDQNNLWKHFKSLSNFLKGEDLTQYQPFTPLILSGSKGASGHVAGFGLGGAKTLLWLLNDDYTAQTAISAQNGENRPAAYIPPLVAGSFVTLDGTAGGSYTVIWYDPQSSEWMYDVTTNAQTGTLTILIPPFYHDMAAKIVRNP